MTDEERIARGQRAASELRLTEEAFTAVRNNLIERMMETADQASILQFHAAVGTVDRVRHALQLVVSDGQMASAAVAQAGLARS